MNDLVRRRLIQAHLLLLMRVSCDQVAWAREYMANPDGGGGSGDPDPDPEPEVGPGDNGDGGHNGSHEPHESHNANSASEAPSLDSLDLDDIQSTATNSHKKARDDDLGGHGDDKEPSLVDNLIAELKSLFDKFVSDSEKTLESLARSLFVCAEVNVEVVAVGGCITSNGNLYNTAGAGTSPGFSLVGGVASGDANNYVNGGSFNVSGGPLSVGVTSDGKNWASMYGISSPGAGYSEGTLVGNVVDDAKESYDHFIESGGRNLQQMQDSILNSATDPFLR